MVQERLGKYIGKNAEEDLPGWDVILASSDIDATLSPLAIWLSLPHHLQESALV